MKDTTDQPAPASVRKICCWDCEGRGRIASTIGPITCRRCDGTGRVPERMKDWVAKGRELRDSRVSRRIGLREEAAATGESIKSRSDREMGYVDPDEHGTPLAQATPPADAPAKDAGETPRTDAEAAKEYLGHDVMTDTHEYGEEVVSAEFARTLERENAALRDELAQVGGELLIAAAEAKDAKAALADGKGEKP